MMQSTKLGIASIAFVFGAIAIWVLWPSGPHLGFVFIFVALVAALLAARFGSRWWFAIPCTLLVVFAFLVWVGFNAH